MPTSKDLKRLVRARMTRTGEAYTAARAQIINKRSTASRPSVASPPPAPADPIPVAPVDYAALAGMADDKIKAATGCDWARWVYALDRRKAYELTHRELAELIHTKYKTPSWWTQMVAVGYERIKGIRAIGQRRDGRYHASKSRTFNVPVKTLFDAWAEPKTRRKWLAGEDVKVRTATSPKSMRLEQDGSSIAVWFTSRGAAKSVVAIDEEKLPSREAVADVKKYWSERLDGLAAVLAD